MSSPSSPSLDAPDAAPLPTSPAAGTAFRNSRWRPWLCCGGALGFGALLAPLFLQPTTAPLASPTGPATALPEIALSPAQTLVVTPSLPPGALLRGRIRLVGGETDALGRARASGQVARHLVEGGTRVQRGDAVLEISSGAGRRVAPRAEMRQSRAEQSQIAASDAQAALAQKISIAQSQLRAAQERVARAQTQVSAARDIVRRVQNGQSVAPGEIPAPFRGKNEAADTPARRGRKRLARPDRASEIAARRADAARQAAQESARALESARTMLAAAQSAANRADEKQQSAAQAVVEVETRFDAKKATGSDVEAARAALKEAQSAVDAADKGIVAAKTELAKREKSAATAQDDAQSSARDAAKAAASAPVAESSEIVEPAPAPPQAAQSLESAIRFAGAALDESRRASREAERLHARIEGYQSQVTSSRSRIEAATQDLAQAQQSVMDSVPRPRFTTSYAPTSGIITWMARLAREVEEGAPVFGITRSQRIAAHFEDKSGLWRSVKPGTVLSAFIVDAPAPATSPTAPGAAISPGMGHAVQLKMQAVQAPKSPAEAARLDGALVAAGVDTATAEGAPILVSMPRPGQKATLSVPASALLQRGTVSYVALLAPLSAPEAATQNAPQNGAAADKTDTGTAQESAPAFRLRWTRVQTGRSDGLRLEITGGLTAGQRVLAQPEDLEAMGFAPAPLPSTVFDTKTAAEKPSDASDAAPVTPAGAGAKLAEVSLPEIVVRLTPEAT